MSIIYVALQSKAANLPLTTEQVVRVRGTRKKCEQEESMGRGEGDYLAQSYLMH